MFPSWQILMDVGLLLVGLLLLGTLGFRYFGSLGWLDSFQTATLFVTGLGSNREMRTTSGKLWSSLFALLGTTLFIGIAVNIVADMVEQRFVSQ